MTFHISRQPKPTENVYFNILHAPVLNPFADSVFAFKVNQQQSL